MGRDKQRKTAVLGDNGRRQVYLKDGLQPTACS